MRTPPFYVPYSFRKLMQVAEAQRRRAHFISRVPSQGTFCDVKNIYHFCCSTCYKTPLSSASTKYRQLFAYNAGDDAVAFALQCIFSPSYQHQTIAAAAQQHKGHCAKQTRRATNSTFFSIPILHLWNIHVNALYD